MLTVDEVKHIALLARIGLSDTEVETYRKDLSSVLDFFHELGDLVIAEGDADDGIPIKTNDYREDTVEDAGTSCREGIMNIVPVKKDGFVKVRSVF
ncbi:MAG: Asp-tRNA(Asn)/Glu-tRNA(Gln) amidotransferase subunit GatC [Candidatus Moranbacteria bacterium]|nr:Asp-tRNA(Asn)/Glu-tRNA(Gln) amidotransferase subunit GatC [Candidatus Moranbacteria bacterium]